MQPNAATPAVSSEDVAEAVLALWHTLMRGGNHALWSLFEELGLGLTQVKTVQTLADCGCEISVKELAERLGMSLPTASRTVDALLRRGYLERREDEHDRRVKRVGITAAGADVVRRIDAARLQNLEAWAATLSAEQRVRLHAALSGLPHRDAR